MSHRHQRLPQNRPLIWLPHRGGSAFFHTTLSGGVPSSATHDAAMSRIRLNPNSYRKMRTGKRLRLWFAT